MNVLNTKRLFQAFPNLYCDNNQPESVTRMRDGFACSDGWYDIIYRLSERLEKLIIEYQKHNKEDPKPPRAFQVKENFGALCFHMSHLTEPMQEAIDEAEQKSHRTCEVCGRPGKLRHDHLWFRTLCDNHNKTR